MRKYKNKIGGGSFKQSKTGAAVWSFLLLGFIGITVYKLFFVPFEGELFSFDTVVVISNTTMIFVSAYWIWLSSNPYNTIYWNDEYLVLYFKSKKETIEIKRKEIRAIDLKLNKLTITGIDGECKSYNTYDMHISYSEINRFRQEFAG